LPVGRSAKFGSALPYVNLQVLHDPLHFRVTLSDRFAFENIPGKFFPLILGNLIQIQAQVLGQVVALRFQNRRQRAQVEIIEQGFGCRCLSIRHAVRFHDLEALVKVGLYMPVNIRSQGIDDGARVFNGDCRNRVSDFRQEAMLLQDMFQPEVRLGQEYGADCRCKSCVLTVQLVEAAVHVHPLLESNQMPGFDPAIEGCARMGIMDSIVSRNLPNAFYREVGQAFKGR
jgi:hypothetical protein